VFKYSMIARILLASLNGTHIGPVVRLIVMRVGLVSVGCRTFGEVQRSFFHVQVEGVAPNCWQ
jgi:hypothetical protein